MHRAYTIPRAAQNYFALVKPENAFCAGFYFFIAARTYYFAKNMHMNIVRRGKSR